MSNSSSFSVQVQGSLTVVALLAGITVAWYALGAVRWEIFLRQPNSRTGRLLRLLFAILIGSGLAGFVVQYATGAAMMRS